MTATIVHTSGRHASGESAAATATAESRAAVDKMRGQNIICFAKDWDEDPTSNNHVMRLLAQDNRVLWLNSIATRAPKLTTRGDLGKIFRKLAAFSRGAKRVTDNLWVYTPIVLPFPHSRLAVAANRWILRTTLRRLRRKMNISDFQLWSFLPSAVEYVGTLGESKVIYYCTDEWSKFGYVDGDKTAAFDQALCRKADVVFATAKSLQERRLPLNPQTYLASHGVDYEMFSKALDPGTPVAPELAELPKPVVGFFGLIHEWIDLVLVEHLASRHPEWSIVLIGKTMVDTSRFAAYPNVHFLGRKPYEDLPKYCKGMAAGLIPFVINELTLNVNPIKLREYLSAGLPVVSTALPEVAPYRDWCVVAENHEQFEQGLAAVLRENDAGARRRRSDAMRQETWERKIAEIGSRVMAAGTSVGAPAPAWPAR